MVSEKDRGQLLRMAGNIACGLVLNPMVDSGDIGKHAAKIALDTMQEVDSLIDKARVSPDEIRAVVNRVSGVRDEEAEIISVCIHDFFVVGKKN